MKHKTVVAFAVLGAAVLAATSACGGGSQQSAGSSAGSTGTFKFALGFQPTTWDPAKADPTSSGFYLETVYDSLLTVTDDNKIAPGLAVKWSYNKTQTQLTLTLRDGVVFSDGERFDANAAVANLEHYKTANGPNSADLATATSIKASGPSTVVVRLAAPDPALVNQLATAIGYMAAPNAIESGELAKQPVGTGPYVLDASSTVVGSRYVFDENPKTWRKNVVYKTLEYLYMSDPNAALDALKGGQVNAAFLSDLQNAADAQRAGYKRVMFGAGPIGLYIFDRGGKITPALKDVRVRKAINYAIDSKAIVDAYLGGTTVGTLTRQQFGPDSDAWDPALNGLYPYNPAKAKELLAEAGYPNGFTVTMPYYPIVGTGVLDTVKAMLGKVGITVKYDQLPSEDVMPALLAGKYSMSLLSQGYVDDWSTMVDQIADTAPFNPFHVQDSHTQRLIHQYQYASDAQRPAIAKQLNAYIVKQAWNNVWAYGMPSILINTKTTKIAHTTYPGYPSALDYKPVS